MSVEYHIKHFSRFRSCRLPALLPQVRYFHPPQGHDPKLDQVAHSQLVTYLLRCYQRMACLDGEALFIDQSYRSWLVYSCVGYWVCERNFESVTVGVMLGAKTPCSFFLVHRTYLNTGSCRSTHHGMHLFIHFTIKNALTVNCPY